MDVTDVLRELQRFFVLEDEADYVAGEDDEGPLSLEGKRHLLRSRLERLSGLMQIVGPSARKEAILANAVRVIKSVWKWIILEEEAEAERKVGDSSDDADEGESLDVPLVDLRESLLRVVNALSPGFPEIVNVEVAAEMIMTFINPGARDAHDEAISEGKRSVALKAIKNICIHSERNRDFLSSVKFRDFDMTSPDADESPEDSFPAFFCSVVEDSSVSALIAGHWAEALAAFLLNDDRRVVPNRAEERKRLITQHGGLASLVRLMSKFREPEQLNVLVIALTLMASSCEQCDLILDAGAFGPGSGLELILQNYTSDERDRLVLNAISCVKNLTVSSAFQQVLKNSFIVKNMLAAARRMKGRFSHAEHILSAVGTVTIRSPTAVAQFLEDDGLDTVFDLVNFYHDSPSVVKSFCLILENVIAHGGEEGKNSVIENDRESLLRELIKNNPELIDTFLKPTLRELGLEGPPSST